MLAAHFGVSVFNPLVVVFDGSETVKESIEYAILAHGRDMAGWVAGEVADEIDDEGYDEEKGAKAPYLTRGH